MVVNDQKSWTDNALPNKSVNAKMTSDFEGGRLRQMRYWVEFASKLIRQVEYRHSYNPENNNKAEDGCPISRFEPPINYFSPAHWAVMLDVKATVASCLVQNALQILMIGLRMILVKA